MDILATLEGHYITLRNISSLEDKNKDVTFYLSNGYDSANLLMFHKNKETSQSSLRCSSLKFPINSPSASSFIRTQCGSLRDLRLKFVIETDGVSVTTLISPTSVN